MFKYFAVLFVLLVLGTVILGVARTAESTRTVIVCSKERDAVNGGGQYRVYTDGGTFVIQDSHWPWRWRTNSADVYGKLHTPGRYRLTYMGWRFSLFSWFPNIMGFQRLPASAKEIKAACD